MNECTNELVLGAGILSLLHKLATQTPGTSECPKRSDQGGFSQIIKANRYKPGT